MLRDRRCTDYLAERFARVYVGTEDGPFILYRRRRFIAWLSDALLENRHYDSLVKEMIADRGLWTDQPATNFVSVTYDPDLKMPTPERLAARVARAFLGRADRLRQCHDHPFQNWKQDDFRGPRFVLRRSELESAGHPRRRKERIPAAGPQDQRAGRRRPLRSVSPRAKPDSGNPREQLAAWVTDPRNPSFSRATVNRVWALLLGRPLAEPVDDLPAAGELHPGLDLLAADFASHDYDLHRLIRVIAASEVFRLDSATTDRTAEDAGRRLGRLSDDAAAARASCRCALPGSLGHDARARSRTGSSGSRRTPAATISSAATATAARMSSTPAAARSRSGSCS